VERDTIEREPELGKTDVSLCLNSWIRFFCDKVENHVGAELSPSACQALGHMLVAARARQHRLISERDDARKPLDLATFEPNTLDLADESKDE
jgi:hypothetical protein